MNLDMSDAFNQEAMGQMMGAAMAGYANALGAAYQEAMAGVAAGGAPPDFQTLAQTTLESYMGSAEFQGLIGQYAAQIVDANAMQREMATKISAALEQSMTATCNRPWASSARRPRPRCSRSSASCRRAFPRPCPWTPTRSRTPSRWP
ncbi:MAG: hypothetical protein ACLSDQ_03500 [Adlercreutzia equolifaciens]